MSTNRRKSVLSYIPGYTENAVLQLIIACTVAYITFAIAWAILMMVFGSEVNFNVYLIGNVALPHLPVIKAKWWTIFTYGWMQYPNGFFELLSNMLWLYCFGSVVQMLVGYKQVIPLFVYSLVVGGIVYLVAQLLPGELGKCPPLLLGPRAGLMGMAVAAVTLTPKYRFYLSDTFSVPIMVVAGIFTVLIVLSTGFYVPVLIMVASGGLMGYLYVRLLRAGFRPGGWMYELGAKLEAMVTPDEKAIARKRGHRRDQVMTNATRTRIVSAKRIDDILDKINQKGYDSLTPEEKDVLMSAGKEDN